MEDKLEVKGVECKGFGTVGKLVMLDRDLSIGAKGLYAYICSYSGNGSSAFPSREKICYDLCITKTTFYKYIKQLEENEYITITKNYDGTKFANNIYTVNKFPCPKKSDTKKSDTIISDTIKWDTNNNNNNINNINNNNNNKKEIYKEKDTKRFIKPSVEEIKEYIDEKGYSVDAEMFYDFYESKGWNVGKSPMKDWKASVRTWQRNNKSDEPTNEDKNKKIEHIKRVIKETQDNIASAEHKLEIGNITDIREHKLKLEWLREGLERNKNLLRKLEREVQ